MTRDDVVLQRPEDTRLILPLFHTSSACCGAVTGYVLRRIAYRAGTYAPGIHDHVFHELSTLREGDSIDKVQRWFSARSPKLQQLGYRLQYRRVATPTPSLVDWVRVGTGYRGAMLPTAYTALHPTPRAASEAVQHAVGLIVDRLDASAGEDVVMIDPWPGVGGAVDRGPVSNQLELAHRARNYHALVYYWTGWA